MANRNGKIILAKNIKLEKSYKNVLDYTDQQMLELVIANKVYDASDFSFINRDDRNYVQIDITYTDAIKANYLAYQNPDYGGKWFFAFIDKVEYYSESSTRIRFTIDEFSTWYGYWGVGNCFVEREHVNDDTIGLHTVPENLEHGDYIINAYDKIRYTLQPEDWVVIGTTWLPSNTPNLPSTQFYGGVYSGVYYLAFDNMVDAEQFIRAMDGFGRSDNIIQVFMAPSYLCNPYTAFTGTLNSKEALSDGTYQNKNYTISGYFITNNHGVQLLTDYTITINSTLNGYTPKNNKLFCFPYNYLLISNNQGANVSFNYEDFINHAPKFSAYGTLCPGCSIKLYPKNYKLYNDGTTILGSGFNDGVIAGKYPICSFSNDTYVNWLTQQSVNATLNQVGSAVKIGGMVMNSTEGNGNPASAYGSLFEQQANYVSERYQRALASYQARGNLNGGDVTFAADQMFFTYYKMSIKAENARIIDEWFTRFGYQINRLKAPNLTGRTYWNFVKIGVAEDIGYANSNTFDIPAPSMEIINTIFRNGVTIWHSHANIGNFTLNNTIVS